MGRRRFKAIPIVQLEKLLQSIITATMSMLTTIRPSGLSGAILAPASKSSMQRACAASLLRVGETIIRHPGHSNDDKAALGVIRDLGAEVNDLEDGSLRESEV